MSEDEIVGQPEEAAQVDAEIESGDGSTPQAGDEPVPNAPDSPGESDPNDPGAKPVVAKNPAQKRIGELTRKQREAERERDYWKSVALEKQGPGARSQVADQPPAETAHRTADSSGKPRVEEFSTYEDFVEALSDWKAQQVLGSADRARTQQESARKVSERTQTAVAKASEKFADFEDVVLNPDLALTPIMAEAVLDCENFAEVAYHLGQHPEEAARIAQLSPAAQAREIGKLEVRLSPSNGATSPGVRKTSNAPAPVVPVKAKGASPKALDMNDPNISTEEYNRLHKVKFGY